jgi:sphingosine-1-phosphate phosphatase 1
MLQPLVHRAAGPLGRFREAKQLGDALQLSWLLRLQSHRSALSDAFFIASSFAGNADFYLLVLPTMIWQGAPKLARQLTYMVTSSLILGNTLKDLVALPRPPSPPVWRPARGAALDSSAFADFGWPSTHAMNAVTNPLLVAAALAPWWRGNATRKAVVVGASVSWCATISFGRLYLGAHSRSDVFAGHVLGALVAAVWVPMAGPFDAAVTTAGALGAWLIAGAVSLSVVLFTLYPSHLLAGASAPHSD